MNNSCNFRSGYPDFSENSDNFVKILKEIQTIKKVSLFIKIKPTLPTK